MDDTRFDNVAKALGSLATRRLTLAALVGGVFGPYDVVETEAAKSGKCKREPGECEVCQKGKCKKKNGKKKCKAGKIIPKANGTACTDPSGNATCQNGVCTCPSPLTNCSGSCRPTQADPTNCGTCGNVCPATTICVASRCCKLPGTPGCTPGADPTCCSGACVPVGNPPVFRCA